MKFILSDERRQGYVYIYYGRKTVEKVPSKTGKADVTDLVDLDLESTEVKYEAFTGNKNGCFQWEYGRNPPGFANYTVNSRSNFDSKALWILSSGGTVGSIATTIASGSPFFLSNPVGWTVSTIGIGIGVTNAVVNAPVPEDSEWVSITNYGGLVVQKPDGNRRVKNTYPTNADKKDYTERHAPGDDAAHDTGDSEKWDVYLGSNAPNKHKLNVGETHKFFVSGSIRAGSLAGKTLISDRDVQVSLTLDISDDRTFSFSDDEKSD